MSEESPTALMLTPDEGFLDRRIAQEANTLARRGWSVDILGTGLPAEPPRDLEPGVRMLPAAGGGTVSEARRFKHKLRSVAPALHRLADAAQSRLSDRASQLAQWHAPRLLEGGPYTVVFAHDLPVLPLALKLKAAWGSAVVCDLHEIYPQMATTASSPRTRTYWRRVEAEALPQADVILCVNAGIEQYVRATYRSAPSPVVVSNAVPYVEDPVGPGLDIKALYGLSDGRPVLAFAGRLETDANVVTLVRGFAQADLPGWVLGMLAVGPLSDQLQREVAEGGLADRILVGKRVPQHELISTLASAQAASLPYLPVDGNHEISTPNKLFEYAQARLPIAASALPGIEPILREHRNGGFVDYSDVETTARGLEQFLGRAELFDQAVLETAARALSWEVQEPAFLGAVDEAMSGSRSTRRRRMEAECPPS